MATLNFIFLSLHNVIRWVFLVLGIVLIVRSFSGWLNKKVYQEQDKQLSSFFTGVFDLQILLGFILYFSTGWAKTLINAAGEVMKTASLRFFAVEHWLLMVTAVVIAHITSAQVKKTEKSAQKYKKAAIGFTVVLILVLASIPWPGMAAGRPWLRFFSLVF